MKLTLLFLALSLIAGQTYIIVIQGGTIEQQQQFIREMVTNPQCMLPTQGDKQ